MCLVFILIEVLGPNYTVYWFGGRVTNGTTWEGLGGRFRLTLVTFALPLKGERRGKGNERGRGKGERKYTCGKRRNECKR